MHRVELVSRVHGDIDVFEKLARRDALFQAQRGGRAGVKVLLVRGAGLAQVDVRVDQAGKFDHRQKKEALKASL